MPKLVSRCASAGHGMTPNDETIGLRADMVRSLKEKGELKDPRLEAAFLSVPRHHFLPELTPEQAYMDEALPVKQDEAGNAISSSSQPTMMAMMLRQLDLKPGHNVLEIGTGTGYNAAIMQHVVGDNGKVTTLELDHDLAQSAEKALQRLSLGSIRVVQADAAGGYAPRAAYDRIIATAGMWDIPAIWKRQLKPRGLIVAPIWLDAMQVSATLRPEKGDTLYSNVNLPCGFIRLRGVNAGPIVTQRVGHSGLILTSNEVPALDSAALHALLSEEEDHTLLDIRLAGSDYFHSFLTYLILNLPPGFTFAAWQVSANQQLYGLGGAGFALIGTGSACFVPFHGHGEAHAYGSSDAFMTLQSILAAWDAAGRPDWRVLRLRMHPKTGPPPTINKGLLYTRQDHYIHAWLKD